MKKDSGVVYHLLNHGHLRGIIPGERTPEKRLRRKTASEDNLINSVIGYDRADLKREDKKFGHQLLIVVLLVVSKQNSGIRTTDRPR